MTEAQIDTARMILVPGDVALLEQQDIITAAEARQILGIDPPDPETPPAPDCERCRGKFVGEIHVNVHPNPGPYTVFCALR